MARKPRTIKNIEAQRKRALASLSATDNGTLFGQVKYIASQEKAYFKPNTPTEKMRMRMAANPPSFASIKSTQRFRQINQAADNAIERLKAQGKAQRTARRAQGLNAG